MLTLQDDTGKVIVTKREDGERPVVALSLDGGKTLRQLGLHHWNSAGIALEDIQEGVERFLHQKDGGVWHLGDEPLRDARGIDLSSATTLELPHRELDFLLKEGGQFVGLVRTQSQLRAWSLQAYVGMNTETPVRLIQRGKPGVVEKDQTLIHVSVGVDDVCRLELTANAERCSARRGSGRLMHGNFTGSRPLTALDPSGYSWGDDSGIANAITLSYTRLLS
jgi:hypothetical protein